MEPTTSVSFGAGNQGLQIGGNHGSIHAEFHLPERPETPPSPSSNVPFPRDPDFVRRDTLIDQIHERRSVPGSRTAVVGLGGVGKSQLAIEYSYQIRSTSPETWVFWIHASNPARFEQSFRALADQLKLPGRRDPGTNIFQAVETWLRDEKKGNWICVLDSVDDESLCSFPAEGNDMDNLKKTPASAPAKPLLEYVPRSPNGSTIITSRSKEVALKIVGHKNLIEVKPMEGSEALGLLQKKLQSPGNYELVSPEETEERRKLVEALEFMPLAIVQAASHIRNRDSRYSVAQYLSDFQSDREATKLLKKDAGFAHRDWEAKNSILVTWGLSFNHIRETKPSAADLLSLMCFFDRQEIPESLIRDQPEAKSKPSAQLSDDSESSESESDDGVDFEEDVATLRNYAFVSVNENGSFTMHRLVQLSTRAWLTSHGQAERWKHQFIKTLTEEFPIGTYDNWTKCQILWPHMISALSQRPGSESQQSLLDWAELLFSGAWYAEQRGLFNDMQEMALLSKKYRVKLLGASNVIALQTTEMLGRAYQHQGQWDKAEHLLLQVMEAHKSDLGADHSSTLATMNSLAITYKSQGRWEEAERLEVQVLAVNKIKLSENHRDTLISMANLALTYYHQGRFKEAEQLLLQAMEKLDCENLDIQVAIDNLASIYRSQGRWDEAEQLDLSVVEMNKTKLGEDHPNTLGSMANLAMTYLKQSRWEEAERLFLEVLKPQKTNLGKDHPDTLMSMANLAMAYREQGQLEEAKRLNIQVIEACKTKFGENHPTTLTSMSNLATIYQRQGHLEEAGKMNLLVLEARETNFEKDHPDTLISMANLAMTYQEQGRLEEAKQLNIQATEGYKIKLGENHPTTLTSMSNLATIYQRQGHLEEAIQLNLLVLEARKSTFEEDHPDTLMSMANLAMAYQEQDRLEEARVLNVHVLEARNTRLGENHPDTLMSKGNLAVIYHRQGNLEEAERLGLQVTEARKMNLGDNHPDTLTGMANLAATYETQGRLEEAKELNQQALKGRKAKLGNDHLDTLTSMMSLASIYHNQERWEDAEKFYVRALEGFRVKLGEDHLFTISTMGNLAMTLKSSGRDAEATVLLRAYANKRSEIFGPRHPDTLVGFEILLAWETAALKIS